MRRRRFDHLYTELCVEVGTRLPRYALWLDLREAGGDPERLDRDDALAFFDERLTGFLHEHGAPPLAARRRRRLRRRLERFDPSAPSPEEQLAFGLR